MERERNVFTSKSSLEFGEDVPTSLHDAVARKKRLRLLSEVVLRTVKRRLASSFAIFLQKNGGWKFHLSPTILNGILSLKTQNFAVK